MTFLHLIADYGTGDPAFGEVIQRFHTLDPSIDVHPTSVPAFSTIATGFWIAQYSLHNPTTEDIAIYANTAPRSEPEPQENNRGEELLYARLENDVPIIAVDAGHTYSFIRDHIDELYRVRTQHSGSQFRSRDFFPEAVTDILAGDRNRLAAQQDIDPLPPPPDRQTIHIDGYGNIKTSLRASDIDLEPGMEPTVTLNGTSHDATYTSGSFEVPHGNLAFAPGSAGGEDPFMELFLRGDSAASLFDDPDIGDQLRYTANT